MIEGVQGVSGSVITFYLFLFAIALMHFTMCFCVGSYMVKIIARILNLSQYRFVFAPPFFTFLGVFLIAGQGYVAITNMYQTEFQLLAYIISTTCSGIGLALGLIYGKRTVKRNWGER